MHYTDACKISQSLLAFLTTATVTLQKLKIMVKCACRSPILMSVEQKYLWYILNSTKIQSQFSKLSLVFSREQSC